MPVGCDVCLQSGSKVQLDCTAKLGAHISETILRYKWSFANTGVSTGVTSPLYTVNGIGQFSCSVTNSGLSTNKTSNVYCKLLFFSQSLYVLYLLDKGQRS